MSNKRVPHPGISSVHSSKIAPECVAMSAVRTQFIHTKSFGGHRLACSAFIIGTRLTLPLQHADNSVEGPSNVNVTFRNSTQSDLVGMKRPYPQLRQTQKTVHCSKRRTATCQLQIRLQIVLGQSKSTPKQDRARMCGYVSC